MKDNKPLLIAFGSLLFYTIALPILDALSSAVQSHINVHNLKLQAEAQKIQEGLQEQSSVQAVGFQIPSDSECEEDYG